MNSLTATKSSAISFNDTEFEKKRLGDWVFGGDAAAKAIRFQSEGPNVYEECVVKRTQRYTISDITTIFRS